jgi:hypothetical protein
MMIPTPAGYRNLGLPVMAWWFVVAIVVVPLGWGL